MDAERAEVIAREWGQAVFGSGDYGDVWRIMSRRFTRTPTICMRILWSTSMASRKVVSCSICRHAALNFDVMRELHAESASRMVELTMRSSSALSRGISLTTRWMKATSREGECALPAAAVDGERSRQRPRCRALLAIRNLGDLAGLAALTGTEASTSSYLSRLARALGLRQGVPSCPITRFMPKAIPPRGLRLRAAR